MSGAYLSGATYKGNKVTSAPISIAGLRWDVMSTFQRRQAAKATLKVGDTITLHRTGKKRFVVEKIEDHAITLSDHYDKTYYCELWEVNEVLREQPNVQIEGQPASGLSRSNAGVGSAGGDKC